MRWQLNNSTTEHEIYDLYKDDQKILTLELNTFSNSARVHYNNEKRVYIIRKEGLRRNKTVIRNEYGVKIGELKQEDKTDTKEKDALILVASLYNGITSKAIPDTLSEMLQ